MRENGYYWVNTYGEWIIAQWNGVYWWFIADDDWYDEDYVKEIGEKVERKENRIALRNTPKLGGKVSVVLLDTETGQEETLMIGAIVGMESTEDGIGKVTVRRNGTVS